MDREDPTFRMRTPPENRNTMDHYNALPPQIQQLLTHIAGRLGRPVESFFGQGGAQPQGQLSQASQGFLSNGQGALSQYASQMQALPQQQTQAPQQPMQSFNNPWSNGMLNRLQRSW